MSNFNDFYKLIIIKEEEKESALNFLRLRGIDEHINVANYLTKLLKRKSTYSEVETTLRYDKRIRRVLYKYIGTIEEIARADISNEYKLVKDLPIKRNSKQKRTFSYLSLLTFKELFDVYKDVKNELDYKSFKITNFDEKVNKLISLRNKVSHNRFLLSKLNISDIENLVEFLPTEIANSFLVDLAKTSKEKLEQKFKTQAQWTLPQEVVIKI